METGTARLNFRRQLARIIGIEPRICAATTHDIYRNLRLINK